MTAIRSFRTCNAEALCAAAMCSSRCSDLARTTCGLIVGYILGGSQDQRSSGGWLRSISELP